MFQDPGPCRLEYGAVWPPLRGQAAPLRSHRALEAHSQDRFGSTSLPLNTLGADFCTQPGPPGGWGDWEGASDEVMTAVWDDRFGL